MTVDDNRASRSASSRPGTAPACGCDGTTAALHAHLATFVHQLDAGPADAAATVRVGLLALEQAVADGDLTTAKELARVVSTSAQGLLAELAALRAAGQRSLAAAAPHSQQAVSRPRPTAAL